MDQDYFNNAAAEIDLLEEEGLLSARQAAELRMRLTIQRHMHSRMENDGPNILSPLIFVPVICLAVVAVAIFFLVVTAFKLNP